MLYISCLFIFFFYHFSNIKLFFSNLNFFSLYSYFFKHWLKLIRQSTSSHTNNVTTQLVNNVTIKWMNKRFTVNWFDFGLSIAEIAHCNQSNWLYQLYYHHTHTMVFNLMFISHSCFVCVLSTCNLDVQTVYIDQQMFLLM